MNSPSQARMLLSHNFDITDNRVPVLDRSQFADVFIEGFKADPQIQCRLVDNPHWIVEVRFPVEVLPQQIGEQCAQILVQRRRSQQPLSLPTILILGGVKTTPATSSSPDALQPGEWGVDVVETASAEQFLVSINWEATIAPKPPDSIFKVELIPAD